MCYSVHKIFWMVLYAGTKNYQVKCEHNFAHYDMNNKWYAMCFCVASLYHQLNCKSYWLAEFNTLVFNTCTLWKRNNVDQTEKKYKFLTLLGIKPGLSVLSCHTHNIYEVANANFLSFISSCCYSRMVYVACKCFQSFVSQVAVC